MARMPELLRKQQVLLWKEQGGELGEGELGVQIGNWEAEEQEEGVRQEVCGVNLSTKCNKNQSSIQTLVLWLKP